MTTLAILKHKTPDSSGFIAGSMCIARRPANWQRQKKCNCKRQKKKRQHKKKTRRNVNVDVHNVDI